jgi:hypothetical protein
MHGFENDKNDNFSKNDTDELDGWRVFDQSPLSYIFYYQSEDSFTKAVFREAVSTYLPYLPSSLLYTVRRLKITF